MLLFGDLQIQMVERVIELTTLIVLNLSWCKWKDTKLQAEYYPHSLILPPCLVSLLALYSHYCMTLKTNYGTKYFPFLPTKNVTKFVGSKKRDLCDEL